MSSVRSARSVGPNRMHTLMGVITPTSAPAVRAFLSALLMTPRSPPSVRLKCVYRWYLVRSVRIACCGFAMAPFLARREVPTPPLASPERPDDGHDLGPVDAADRHAAVPAVEHGLGRQVE